MEDDFEITIFDADLGAGEPMYHGQYGYRVNIFGGEIAGRYTQSTGFATADPVYVFGNMTKG